LLEHPARLTITVVLITQVARFASLILIFQSLQSQWGATVAFWVILASLPILAFLLEFLPKLLFTRFPDSLLVWFARMLRWCDLLLGPLLHWVHGLGWSKFLLQHGRNSIQCSAFDTRELRQAFNSATDAKTLTPLQKHLLHSILNARTIQATSVTQKLAELNPIPEHWPISDALDFAETHGLERLLVIAENGQPLGYLRRLDLIFDGITTGRAQSYVRQLNHVPPDTTLLSSIQLLRAARSPMALCVCPDGSEGILLADELVRRLLHGPISTNVRPQPQPMT
jgi:CBS domain containing-hemolysin-like protein